MKNKLMISSIIILIVLSISLSICTISIIKKHKHLKVEYEYLKTEFEVLKRFDTRRDDRLDTVTLKLSESIKIRLGNKQYTLKLLRIDKDPIACIGTSTWQSCTKQADYGIEISINGIVFSLDSNLNYSAPIITIDFRTEYIIYYIPEYKEKEAIFLIEKDALYKKETNLIIGNYIVYVDNNNKIIDINTFTREVQTWGKQYAGKDLKDIKELINSGKDLEKDN